MMQRCFWAGLLFAAVAAFAGLTPASAEEPKAPPQPYVLLIGVNQYGDPKIEPRPYAEEDIKSLYDLLTDKKHLDLPADHVKLLLGTPDSQRGSEPATRANILKALEWLRNNARADDPVIFAFFGAGGPVGEEGGARRCYFASDSTVKDRATNAVSANEIGEEFKKLKSQRVVALLDVNFKSINADPPLDVRLGENPYGEFLGDDESAEHNPMPGRVVYLASNGLSAALDLKEKGHSLFGLLVRDGLKGDADKDGGEPDGVVTTRELATYLEKEAPKLWKEFAPKAKAPVPVAIGTELNRFVLTENPAEKAKIKEQVEKLAALLKDNPELAREGKELLERMPPTEAKRALRKNYIEFVNGKLTQDAFLAEYKKRHQEMTLAAGRDTKFANTVMEAARLVEAEYVTEGPHTKLPTLVHAAITGLYRRLDEEPSRELKEKLAGIQSMKAAELQTLLADARRALGQREDLDDHKDIDIALLRMLNKLDPHSTYFGPVDKARFQIDLKAEYTGIGAVIRKDPVTDWVRIVSPIRGGPAYNSGKILADDLIVKLIRETDSDGKPLKDPKEKELETKDLALPEVVKRLLGDRGTKVKLLIHREGRETDEVVEITRGSVKQETVLGFKRKENDEFEYMIDEKNKIGYVRLSSFAPATASDLKQVLEGLKERGLKSLILDLRFNGGGLLNASVTICDMFLDTRSVVQIRKPRKNQSQSLPGTSPDVISKDVKMVVLVNGSSASASEIVSACLQDHDRAKIGGERSFGKGSVQSVIDDFDGGDLKLTIAGFFSPKGRNLNKLSTKGTEEEEWGVRPDPELEVKLPKGEEDSLFEWLQSQEVIKKDKKDVKPFTDRQLEKALEYLRKN